MPEREATRPPDLTTLLNLARIEEVVEAVERDRFLGPRLRSGHPRLPTHESLPTATEDYAYRKLIVMGTPDVEYTCLRDAAGTWGWRVAATG